MGMMKEFKEFAMRGNLIDIALPSLWALHLENCNFFCGWDCYAAGRYANRRGRLYRQRLVLNMPYPRCRMPPESRLHRLLPR